MELLQTRLTQQHTQLSLTVCNQARQGKLGLSDPTSDAIHTAGKPAKNTPRRLRPTPEQC